MKKRGIMKTVYTKKNCPGCVQLKAKLDASGEQYETIEIGKDITLEEFLGKYPDVKTVPFVVES